MRIAFIGGGNMTTSLVGGLVRRGTEPGSLTVSDPMPAQVERLAREFGVHGVTDNREAVREADMIVLAVKPQQMAEVACGIAPQLVERRPIVVSIAAGIRLADLARWLGAGMPIVRTMPNRPALIGAGITALYADGGVTTHDRDLVEVLMSAAGATVWLDHESQMDVVTAISGSGPAYFFLLIEALESAGIASGMSASTARRLAVATARGAGLMAAESDEAPAVLREQVTSAGGTTAAALEVLEAAAVRDTFGRAVAAATQRSAQLADEFGGA
jgi:pyrroline-5-carboxylate reductase